MRNVAFSIMLVALALLQVAVVSTELSQAPARTAVIAKADSGARQVLASTQTVRKTSSL